MTGKSTKVGKAASSHKGFLWKVGWALLGLAAVGLASLVVMWSVYSRDADDFAVANSPPRMIINPPSR